MTEILMRVNIIEPTKQINPDTFKPMMQQFRNQIQEFMQNNLPTGASITVKRITKARRDKLMEKKACMICGLNFDTIMAERKVCSDCTRIFRGKNLDPKMLKKIKKKKKASDLGMTIPTPRGNDGNSDYLEFYSSSSNHYERV